MTDATQQQLISDIAHELVAQIAPRALPLFRVTSKAYIDNPQKVFKNRKPDDEMLGFGVDTAVIFWTPVVLAVTTKVVTFLAEKVIDALKMESCGPSSTPTNTNTLKLRCPRGLVTAVTLRTSDRLKSLCAVCSQFGWMRRYGRSAAAS